MATVTLIPAHRVAGARKKAEEAPKLRVAAYCRVSMRTLQNSSTKSYIFAPVS